MMTSTLERAIVGDKVALDQLLAENQTKVFQVALHTMGNVQDAQDIAQEAMIRIYRNIHKCRGEASFLAWARRITVNACLDELRKRKIRPKVSLEGMLEAELLPHPQSEEPAQVHERRARLEKIHAALQNINEEQRLAVVLRDIQGLSYEEVANAMDCNLNTAKSRIARGRLALRAELKKDAELFGLSSV